LGRNTAYKENYLYTYVHAYIDTCVPWTYTRAHIHVHVHGGTHVYVYTSAILYIYLLTTLNYLIAYEYIHAD